jgi:phage/plasmid-like protein (TIGR03299 family)
MSHKFESGFFSRQAAWHKLGVVIPDGNISYKDAYEISGLNWDVLKQPLMWMGAQGWKNTDRFALVRDSDERTLGYCSDRYNTYQNLQALEWTRPFVESGLWEYSACGSLRQGAQCWVLLGQGHMDVLPGDRMNKYLLSSWGHDGQTPLMSVLTGIRVVCDNTIQMALSQGRRDSSFRKIFHHANVVAEMDLVREMYAESEMVFSKQAEQFRAWAQVEMSEALTARLVDETLEFNPNLDAKKALEADAPITLARKERTHAMEMALSGGSGADALGIKGSLYGASMGLSESIEHYLQAKSADRGRYVLCGAGATSLRRMWNAAAAIATEAGVN